MNVVFNTDIGCAREENQDRVKTNIVNDNVALAVLCDGMGGQNAGSVASEIAINIIYDRLCSNLRDDSDDNSIKNIMFSSVVAANSVVFNKSKQDEEKNGMGTTCVAVIVANKKAHVLNVGDSRAYLIKSDSIKQLTNDHTFVRMLLNKGEIEEHEIKNHPQRNCITKAVGVEMTIEPDYFEDILEDGDIVMLCSDGLTNSCTDQEILETVKTLPLNESATKLIERALSNNGKDNITLAMIEI